jgi:hypothetical protein
MKRLIYILILLAASSILSGCVRAKRGGGFDGVYALEAMAMPGSASAGMAEVRPDRMLVWKAHLSMQVWNVSNAVAQATALAEAQDGYVES